MQMPEAIIVSDGAGIVFSFIEYPIVKSEKSLSMALKAIYVVVVFFLSSAVQ
jgi:type III secretory pathway component EscS